MVQVVRFCLPGCRSEFRGVQRNLENWSAISQANGDEGVTGAAEARERRRREADVCVRWKKVVARHMVETFKVAVAIRG
jgi:hypothetical protein